MSPKRAHTWVSQMRIGPCSLHASSLRATTWIDCRRVRLLGQHSCTNQGQGYNTERRSSLQGNEHRGEILSTWLQRRWCGIQCIAKCDRVVLTLLIQFVPKLVCRYSPLLQADALQVGAGKEMAWSRSDVPMNVRSTPPQFQIRVHETFFGKPRVVGNVNCITTPSSVLYKISCVCGSRPPAT